MIRKLLLSSAFALLTLGSQVAQAQTSCPANTPILHAAVQSFVADDRIRSDLGLSSVNPASLRILTDSGDAATCQSLRQRLPTTVDSPYQPRWIFFTANGFYFAALIKVTSGGEYSTAPAYLWVMDGSFRTIEVSLL